MLEGGCPVAANCANSDVFLCSDCDCILGPLELSYSIVFSRAASIIQWSRSNNSLNQKHVGVRTVRCQVMLSEGSRVNSPAGVASAALRLLGEVLDEERHPHMCSPFVKRVPAQAN